MANTYVFTEQDKSQSIFIHFPNFLNQPSADAYFKKCEEIVDWKGGEYKTHTVNRLQRYYNINGESFSKYWKNTPDRWQPQPYEDWLIDLQDHVGACINDMYNIPCNFQSALMNKYSNGYDLITKHKDTSNTPDPTVASISFGAPRVFKIHRTINDIYSTKDAEPGAYFSKSWILGPGDLFIMAGSSQRYFTHELVGDERITNVRYNISFRTN